MEETVTTVRGLSGLCTVLEAIIHKGPVKSSLEENASLDGFHQSSGICIT